MQQSARTAPERTHYVWESPAHDIAILLNLRLIDRLQQLVRQAPDREIGGVLLGNCDDPRASKSRRVVLVEDFEPVPSQHIRGPAYTLKPQDANGLLKSLSKASIRRGKVPVGFFRSHLRKGLYLDEADFSLFQAHFSGPCDVFLLARPEPKGVPVGGFFSWEDESLNRRSSYVTFPLDAASLSSGPYTLMSSPEPDAAPVRTIVPKLPVVRVNRSARKWVYGAAGALMIFTALLLFVLMRLPGDAVSARSRDVALSVQRDGPALRLNWNAEAPAISRANSGTLWISDGGQQHRLDLSANALKQGSFVYTPQSNDVNFRLDLLNVAEQGTESVRYVGDKMPELAVAPPPPQREVAAAPAEEPPPAVASRRNRRTEDDDEDGADRAIPHRQHSNVTPASNPQANTLAKVVTPPAETERTEALPAIPAPPPAVVQQPVTQLQPVRVQRVHADPTVNIVTEPITPQRLRDRLRPEWMSKVPLAGVLHLSRNKENERFVPPQVSHQVKPQVPARLARDMAPETRLEFKISIDREGKVNDIVLTSDSDPRLADVAAAAVSQWHFAPAQFKDKPVASDLMVIMHFHNPDGALAQRQTDASK